MILSDWGLWGAAVHIISDNDLFQRLAFDNPWWEFSGDTKIEFRHPPKRAGYQALADKARAAADASVTVLAGPLRAGKTVMLRQMVADVIESGVPPTSVFYCNMTVPSYTSADLATLFEMFCRRYHHKADAELYVFYDEIQYVRGWQDAVLALAKLRPKARIVAAVSSGAPALTTGASVAGGRLSVIVLPPLSFLEFLRFRGTEKTIFGDNPGDGPMALRAEALPALNAEFHRYVNFGGFLEGIVGKTQGSPAPTFIRDGLSDRVLHKDLSSLAGINDAQELNKLFGILSFNTGREVTMDDLAKAAGIAKNTLRKYLDYLESAFLIRRVARVDKDAKRFQRQVAFKVYLTAPCLYAAQFGPVPVTDAAFRRLAETALVCQWLGTGAVDNLAYASWRGGGIDLLSLDPATDQPDHVYELDWTNAYGRERGPDQLVRFVEATNPGAKPYILTMAVARPATMRGLELTLAPLALYAYWVGRGQAD